MSGFAAVVPTRPAISVLGGSATSSVPAFPNSCAAAAAAAAAAVRGCEGCYRCTVDAIRTNRLRIIVLYYNCTIVVIAIICIETNQCQCLPTTTILTIVENETFFDSPLRGN